MCNDTGPPDSDPTTDTADVVLFARDTTGLLHVLLIRRAWAPFDGWWALPGSHVDPGETPLQAARRALTEETGQAAPSELTRVGVYDRRGRDPRGRISTAYTALLQQMPTPLAGGGARSAEWVPVPLATDRPLAFDHAVILTDALTVIRRVREGT